MVLEESIFIYELIYVFNISTIGVIFIIVNTTLSTIMIVKFSLLLSSIIVIHYLMNFISAVYLEIPNWSPEMHVNWSLCMKLYISAPEDMEQAANMFIEVCTSSV